MSTQTGPIRIPVWTERVEHHRTGAPTAERAVLEVTISDQTHPLGKPDGSRFMTIDHKVATEGKTRISFTVGTRHTWSGRPSLDQVSHDDFVAFETGWDLERWTKLVDVATRWHLNDVRAYCVHQRDQAKSRIADADGFGNVNGKAWWEHVDPCPLTGYRCGSDWLYEPIPDDARADIAHVLGFSIPELWAGRP